MEEVGHAWEAPTQGIRRALARGRARPRQLFLAVAQLSQMDVEVEGQRVLRLQLQRPEQQPLCLGCLWAQAPAGAQEIPGPELQEGAAGCCI